MESSFHKPYKAFINEQLQPQKETSDIPSGLPSLDKQTGKFLEGEFIVVGGRPGMGKTSLVLNMINHISFNKRIPTLLVSLENRHSNVYRHLLALRCNVSMEELRSGKSKDVLEKEKLLSVKPFYLEAPIHASFEQITATIIHQVIEHKIKVVFIDSIQEIDEQIRMDSYGYFGYQEQEYTNSKTRSLKKLCSELNITLVITSQLSRAVEERGGDKKPNLADLKWSSSLEDVADRILMVYRPIMYRYIEDSEGRNVENSCFIIAVKNRYGLNGSVEFGFEEGNGKFIDINSYPI